MKVYLDNCCFNRPFDDQSQLKIRLESEAKREPFDYTPWRHNIDEDLSIAEISHKAMGLKNKDTLKVH